MNKQYHTICNHLVLVSGHWVTIYTDDIIPEVEALSLKRQICKYLFLEGILQESFAAVLFHKI